jgi:DNA replication licensing factor MCM7
VSQFSSVVLHVEILDDFFQHYDIQTEDGEKIKPYWELLKKVADRRIRVVPVHLDDITQYPFPIFFSLSAQINAASALTPLAFCASRFVMAKGDIAAAGLPDRIQSNTMHYIELMENCIDQILPQNEYQIVDDADPIDVLRMYRSASQKSSQRSTQQQEPDTMDVDTQQLEGVDAAAVTPINAASDNALPRLLTRRYELIIIPPAEKPTIPLRQVKATLIGKLLRVRGIVTRVTEVKPLLVVATYNCDSCGLEAYQEVTQRTFMPMLQCPSTKCKLSRQPGKLNFQTRGSKFVKFQELKLQELSAEVPIGHVPRTVTIHLMGERTRTCTPGDIITIDGVFLPTPNLGFKAMRSGQLVSDTFIHAMSVSQEKKSFAEYIQNAAATSERVAEFWRTTDEPYKVLSASIAPEIFGMEDVKKALLLQMVGGVTRNLENGMRIRGDVNVCLMGDPGVAKSQLLKHISTIAPRAVYTSGKGSSGVGLTAAVLRDPNTKEFVLEGGSLVMADMGICCIDEFDKMEDSDRTAIHEVMEQQTISIAKAGITTTLNARTSILAAANPAWGRYNPRKTPAENINLPAALLSRFDLMFLLLDEPDALKDRQLAEHITHVHRFDAHPSLGFTALTAEFIRDYVATAKMKNPSVPRELRDFIVSAYVGMRHIGRSNTDPFGGSNGVDHEDFGFTTARTLLGILRLSQALARLRFSDQVGQGDVEEAIRLMDRSKLSLMESRAKKTSMDPISTIFNIIREAASAKENLEIGYEQVRPQVMLKGFTEDQLNEVLDEYDRLGIWVLSADRRIVTLVPSM